MDESLVNVFLSLVLQFYSVFLLLTAEKRSLFLKEMRKFNTEKLILIIPTDLSCLRALSSGTFCITADVKTVLDNKSTSRVS